MLFIEDSIVYGDIKVYFSLRTGIVHVYMYMVVQMQNTAGYGKHNIQNLNTQNQYIKQLQQNSWNFTKFKKVLAKVTET